MSCCLDERPLNTKWITTFPCIWRPYPRCLIAVIFPLFLLNANVMNNLLGNITSFSIHSWPVLKSKYYTQFLRSIVVLTLTRCQFHLQASLAIILMRFTFWFGVISVTNLQCLKITQKKIFEFSRPKNNTSANLAWKLKQDIFVILCNAMAIRSFKIVNQEFYV